MDGRCTKRVDLEEPRHPRKLGQRVGAHLAAQSFAMQAQAVLELHFARRKFVQKRGHALQMRREFCLGLGHGAF